MLRKTIVSTTVVALLVLAALTPAAARAANIGNGPGGPILVVPGSDPFGRYYAEILQAEGLNEFDVGPLTADALATHRVVVLAQGGLGADQVAMLSNWVAAGGNLVAMRPGAELAGLLGLGADGGDLANGYVGVQPGRGVTTATMQYHGTGDRWTGGTATTVATLYSDAGTATGSPAVTLRGVGTAGGQAAAFTYDLARSVVYTRQGDPALVGQRLDGQDGPIRADNLFFDGWLDRSKVAIPQADEQQRLLADLVVEMSRDSTPLPRFWYLPRGDDAAVVMTGDDHGQGGTSGRFQSFEAASPPGCSVADWECIRSTSYVYPGTPNLADAGTFQAAGFEIGLHLSTGCADFTPASLAGDWASQLSAWRSDFPGLNSPRTSRTHCIAWSDWLGEANAELANGVRLDTNYYYWPPDWVGDQPGVFTGSGFPMRFAGTDGSVIDVYQAATQITDESGMDIPAHIAALLDRAQGPQGWYGVFTVNMHTDTVEHAGADAIVQAAKARGVPVVSAVQMLDWLDGRNGSSFQNIAFSGRSLTFGISRAAGARGLEGMLPNDGPTGALAGLTRDGTPVPVTSRTVKGIEYAVFDAAGGSYVATYGAAAAPETTITSASTTTDGATFTFASDTAGARFECELDGAALQPCTSPRAYTGLAAGAHTFVVRAIDAGGIADPTPAARTVIVTGPSTTPPGTPATTPPGSRGEGGGAPGGSGRGVRGGTVDRHAPRVSVRPHRVVVSRRGRLALRVACPAHERSCRVRLRLRRGHRTLATRKLTVAGGDARRARLRLTSWGRRQLARKGSLKVTAVAVARDRAGNRATTRTSIRLLAPRKER